MDLATKNPEEGACVFIVDSKCTADDYLLSTSCSNCSYNGSAFICNDVPPGENCRFSIQAILNNLTSLESDPIFCANIIGGEYINTVDLGC